MPSTSYLIAVLAIVFTITLALRAVPFTVLRALRSSAIVRRLSAWMPVGILAILAVTALHGTIGTEPRDAVRAAGRRRHRRRPPRLRPPHDPQRRSRHGRLRRPRLLPGAVQRHPRSGATCSRMFSSRWAL
ncbi:hypothetical protein GCM10023196_073050 [Actinoallomurus vinaceus]|uniref:Uncharacterized protein n=1 Tax=Actinoallomurus vinaceus TaxID=1080074 RepID=A0ABP8UPE0_9ACTN